MRWSEYQRSGPQEGNTPSPPPPCAPRLPQSIEVADCISFLTADVETTDKRAVYQGLTAICPSKVVAMSRYQHSYQVMEPSFSKKPSLSWMPTLSLTYKNSQAVPVSKPVQRTFLSSVLPPSCSSISLTYQYVWKFLFWFLSWGIQEPQHWQHRLINEPIDFAINRIRSSFWEIIIQLLLLKSVQFSISFF